MRQNHVMSNSADYSLAWPFFGLRVSTPIVELAYPTDETIPQIIELAKQGIHHPNFMPFSIPWSSATEPELDRSMAQFYWKNRADLTPTSWLLPLAVMIEGEPVGVQDVRGENFGLLGIAETGSWLASEHQGRGIGKEMRAAILHLLFEGLGARRAVTQSRHDNASSLAVTRSLGYEANGTTIEDYGDNEPLLTEHFFMSRETWQKTRRDDIQITGLADCLDMLGLGSSSSAVSESEAP